MLEAVDYEIIYPKKETESVQFKVLTGEYTGTIFRYGSVKIEEKNDGPHLQFSFYVLKSDVMKPSKLEKDENFKRYAGDFLVNYMTESIEDETYEDRDKSDKTPDLLG